MSLKDRMATDPVCGMKADIVVGLPGLEPETSSFSEKRDGFLDFSSAHEYPANSRIFTPMLFLGFQHICPGCCTVAAPMLVADAKTPLQLLRVLFAQRVQLVAIF
jgi:hypothetical protein